MAVQLSAQARSDRLDAIETTLLTAPKLQIRTGAQPADCATADSGTLLCEIALPSDWMNPASGGTKTKLGTWSGTASAGGVAAHFRIKNTAGTVTHMQGSVGQGTGDMSLDNTTITNGQTVTVNSFTLTDANA
jgi:hypothetical protein